MSRPVTEADLRQPEFRHSDPCDYEFDGDGKLARKDRWEVAMRNIVSILMARGDMRISSRRFELAAVVEAVRELASRATLTRCQADSDGDCEHSMCPQFADHEPASTGRSCPLYRPPEEA